MPVVASSPPRSSPRPPRSPKTSANGTAALQQRAVTVYQYVVLDTNRVELRKARRWRTREAIDGLKDAAQTLEDSATMVDASALNDGGFTKLDFDPRSG